MENEYDTNRTAYNEAQTKEKLLFFDVLADLCSYVPKPPLGVRGRPKAEVGAMVFCCAVKEYDNTSSRRLTSDLVLARSRRCITHVPHFNTVLKYLNQTELTPVLTDLIKISAIPLKDLEDTFAVDASGLTKAFYTSWFDFRFGKIGGERTAHDWLKIHLICGVKSNIVTHIVVTDGRTADSPQFPELVRETAKNFRIKEVSADKGYSFRENHDAAFSVGATPFIPFKSNATDRLHGSTTWRKMYHYFQLHREEYMRHYYKRSNVESTFSMLKRKFGYRLMLKNEVGQVNEALARVLCHNICALIKEFCEGNADLEFKQFAHLFPSLHTEGVKGFLQS